MSAVLRECTTQQPADLLASSRQEAVMREPLYVRAGDRAYVGHSRLQSEPCVAAPHYPQQSRAWRA